ncbi:MAG: nucleotidyltransferase domain-containing protein [Chitinophagaceae bacterium]|jgi:predicted nucleotidyltransferase|nr:nucleotidyltransferase domain-containing protein [Chitinophagaceae bacterium]
MLTTKDLNNVLKAIPEEMAGLGIVIERMVLFGSYAKRQAHAYSDVDIALWSPQFTGLGLIDLPLYQPILRKYPFLDIKTFPANATAYEQPFLEVIEQEGKEINCYEEEIGIE